MFEIIPFISFLTSTYSEFSIFAIKEIKKMTPKLLKTSLTISLLLLSIASSFGQLDNSKTRTTVPLDLIQPNIEVEEHEFIDPRITDDTKVEAALAEISALACLFRNDVWHGQ